MLLTEIIERNARRRPHKEAAVSGNIRITHAELSKRVERTASCLSGLGICKGDRVLVQMSNIVPYVELYFAVPKLGAILVPLNVRLTPTELPYYISHTGSICMIADFERAEDMEKGLADWGKIRERIVVGASIPGWRSFENMPPNEKAEWPSYNPSAENEVAYIYYTSGTTGRPKGAMWTNRQIIENLVNLQLDLPLTPEDTSLVAVNLAHGPSVLPVLHQTLYMGGKVVLYPGPQFKAEEFSGLAKKESANTTLLVPTMLSRLLHQEGAGHDWFKDFKYIKYAAAKMDYNELRLAVERIKTRLTQGYGSTETVGGVTFLPPSEHDPRSPNLEVRLASAGREYQNVRVAVTNEQGRLLPPGEIGQIVVRSDKNFAGYWRDPQSTAKTYREGWLLTGDLGRLDHEGYLYVMDRVADMIISGGENIYAREVEDVLLSLSSVSECAVVGVPDPEWGESVWAFVKPGPGCGLRPETVIEFCKGRLSSYKKPRHAVVCEELPKNAMGKVRKNILREEAQRLIEADRQNELREGLNIRN